MITIVARNVHRALSHGLYLLDSRGVKRDSRNGKVSMIQRVATEYTNPWERVIFWPQRDANPFFHLFESLWMLAGRRDLAPLVQYAKQMAAYSDNGYEVNGSAYGYRWRTYFDRDQLAIVARRLRENPDDRQCVLQMWNSTADLDSQSKDVPCNLTATTQRDGEGRLELAVFCRSNDVVWGAYGANAVHFSMLQEYLAVLIGCPIGTYEQVSVNYHIYSEWKDKLREIPRQSYDDPYSKGDVHYVPMMTSTGHRELDIESLDAFIKTVVQDAASNVLYKNHQMTGDPWRDMVTTVLRAHEHYRHFPAPQRFPGALDILKEYKHQQADWIVAAREWVQRKADKILREWTMIRFCGVCGKQHESEEVMTLDDLRQMLVAAGDRCPTTWDVLNVASVVITEVDRINEELVKLRAQVPKRIKFEILDPPDTNQMPSVQLSVEPKKDDDTGGSEKERS